MSEWRPWSGEGVRAAGGPCGWVAITLTSVLPRKHCPSQPAANAFSSGLRGLTNTRSACSRRGPASPRPSLTSRPRTPPSSASAAVTSSRSWSTWTRTGGEAGSAGRWVSSPGATSSRCTSDRSGAGGRASRPSVHRTLKSRERPWTPLRVPWARPRPGRDTASDGPAQPSPLLHMNRGCPVPTANTKCSARRARGTPGVPAASSHWSPAL